MPSTFSRREGFLDLAVVDTARWNMPASDRTPRDESQQAELQRLTEALALAERDRQLLGYEIHDGVVQDLSAAAMYLEGAGREAQFASADAQASYASGLRLVREAIVQARRLVRGAAPIEFHEVGLVSLLQQLAEKFRADHALAVDFSSSTAECKAPASVQQVLLRIAQEALYNIWKHAQAKSVQLRLAADEKRLELSIADDGVGFDPEHASPGHFGLEGIRARARAIGADLQIDSRAGQGTRITVRLPQP